MNWRHYEETVKKSFSQKQVNYAIYPFMNNKITKLRTILQRESQNPQAYYSDSWRLSAVMKGGGLAL
jgi:hypothetical protein